MMDNLKERLGAKDDEWQAISPRLEKVMTLSFQSRAGGAMRMFGRNRGGDQGGGNRFGGQSDSAVSRAQQDLNATLDNPNASADEIANRLKALRDAHEQAKQELVKAQQDLKEILTQRQEAVLVMMGMLD
jgi:ribosomal protein L9